MFGIGLSLRHHSSVACPGSLLQRIQKRLVVRRIEVLVAPHTHGGILGHGLQRQPAGNLALSASADSVRYRCQKRQTLAGKL